jgi:uncharacterized protein (DUF1800 family)
VTQTVGYPGSPAIGTSTPPRQPYRSSQLQGDQRAIHALNRFTFGPRPGDLAAVRNLGLDQWFDRQLHPETIDQTDLEARLAQYPAMQWSSEDLLYRLPSNAVIRQALDGKVSVPDHGALHAVYENEMYRVEEKRQEKQNKEQQTAADSTILAAMPTAQPTGAGKEGQQSETAARLLDSLDNTIDKDERSEGMATPTGATQSAAKSTVFDTVVALPPQQRIVRLVAMQPSEFETFFKPLRGPERTVLVAGMTPEMKQTVGALENPQRTVVEELLAERLARDLYSNAQLQEVMTDFWLNHFNVYLRKNEATPYYLVSYERDVIRPHALGRFEDLLEAVAHSPAMLLYLDNAESIGPDSLQAERVKVAAERNKTKKAPEGLNENYARELMELHTLGVNGGYTQADVIQAARIFTGWTVERPQRGGRFQFDERRHEPGTKKVLGKKFKEHGELEGRDLLHLLATRPATAQFLSRKLAGRFVSDDPPQALVDRMAKAYLKSDGDIATVLRTLYRSPEFWSEDVYRAKVKTPLEYIVSAARASNAQIANMQPVINNLRSMGMPLYECIPPTGYKWDAADWVSTGALVNRMNFSLALASNHLNGISTSWVPPREIGVDLQSPAAAAPGPTEEEARLESLLIVGTVSATTRSAVLQQFEQQNTVTAASVPIAQSQRTPAQLEKQDQLLAGLLLGSPEFQRR